MYVYVYAKISVQCRKKRSSVRQHSLPFQINRIPEGRRHMWLHIFWQPIVKNVKQYSLECLLFLEKHLCYHFIIRRFFTKFVFLLQFINYVYSFCIPLQPPLCIREVDTYDFIAVFGIWCHLRLLCPGPQELRNTPGFLTLYSVSLPADFFGQNEDILISVRSTPLRC